MATLKELRDERLRKLDELKKLGVNPYPADSARTHNCKDVVDDFVKHEGEKATVVGRIVTIRNIGKLAFIVIRDASGRLQLFLRANGLEAADYSKGELKFTDINLLDSGDFIEATGPVIKTQTGEISVDVAQLRILTKSLRPMPTTWDGFTNKEERLRRRYIDANVNPDVFERYIRRSKFWQAHRDFLNKKGFIEINTPVLEHTTGGADARPFKTHMDALGQDFYLRISQELPLKRLLGAGYEKVYDIGPRFRNENYSDEHLPEHIAMEWYWAYADAEEGKKFTKELFQYVYKEVYGTLKFKIRGFDVDLESEWKEIDYAEIIKKHYDLDVFTCTLDQVKAKLKEHKLEVEKSENIARGIDKLWKKVRATIGGPAFLVNMPVHLKPLAKTDPKNSSVVQHFHPVIAGSELGNGYSELNDPIDQLDRFKDQQAMRDAGDEEAQMLDIDYVEMLEYGMPPACGYGHSERNFWFFEGVTAREGVPFPQLRREIDQVTKSIYPDMYSDVDAKVGERARAQDFTRRIVVVLNKELETWQVTNAVAHMNAIIGTEIDKEKLVTADMFVTKDGIALPRNPQYPIIVKRGDEKELHKLYKNIKAENLLHHVFVKEMQDTTDDEEITKLLLSKTVDNTVFYGVTFFAPNNIAEKLTKHLQLYR